MAANKKVKAVEVSASTVQSAKKAMQALKVDKVFVSKDGYIFPKECDVRAYVGKDGEYSTITDETQETVPAKEKGTIDPKKEKDPASIDPKIDEHKTEE